MILPLRLEQASFATGGREIIPPMSLEIGAGLGPLAGKIWRIGLMGYSSNQKNVMYCLESLNSILKEIGADINPDACISAATETYAKQKSL